MTEVGIVAVSSLAFALGGTRHRLSQSECGDARLSTWSSFFALMDSCALFLSLAAFTGDLRNAWQSAGRTPGSVVHAVVRRKRRGWVRSAAMASFCKIRARLSQTCPQLFIRQRQTWLTVTLKPSDSGLRMPELAPQSLSSGTEAGGLCPANDPRRTRERPAEAKDAWDAVRRARQALSCRL